AARLTRGAPGHSPARAYHPCGDPNPRRAHPPVWRPPIPGVPTHPCGAHSSQACPPTRVVPTHHRRDAVSARVVRTETASRRAPGGARGPLGARSGPEWDPGAVTGESRSAETDDG